MMNKIFKWIKENKQEFLLLLLILFIGAFFRLYQIRGHATFLGDEGRDAIIIKRMIVDHKFTLLGPTISFGNLYLGPVYYYFMIIPLWLTGLDPVGPAMMVGLFGLTTIFLVWLTGKEFFGSKVGLIASLLYAVSPLVITHTRSSWNPNPMPFFSLLAIYGLYKAVKDKEGKWLALVGACLGVAIQLHYIAFVLIISVILMLIIFRPKIYFRWYLVGILAFLVAVSPQLLFEIRHNFVNLRAMINLALKKGEFVESAGIGLEKFMPLSLYNRLFVSLIATKEIVLGTIIALICGVTALLAFLKEKKAKIHNPGLLIILLWIFLGVFGIPLYQGKIHDHYLGFLFPAPFLLFGFTVNYLFRQRRAWMKIVVFLVIAFLAVLNLSKTNVLSNIGPNYQIDRVKVVAKTIAEDVGNRKFNIAMVSATKDFFGYNYRYFLELFGKTPEPYDNFSNIDVLYVIEEEKWVSPEELGLWEIGTFGPATVSPPWRFDFQVVVYRLDHKK